MITPREILRDYLTVLNILVQNPEVSFDEVIEDTVTLDTEDETDEISTASVETVKADDTPIRGLAAFEF